MSYDPYGRPVQGTPMHQQYAGHGPHNPQSGDGYGYADGSQQEAPRQALLSMPTAGQMGGPSPVSFVRFPYYPTSPFYSTNPNVGYQSRFYGQSMLFTDSDYQVGSESIRVVQFDIPCRLIAMNGSALFFFGNPLVPAGLPLGVKANDTFLFRAEYTTGDKLHTAARLGSTVLGTDENPGEIGGAGYTIDAGASFVLGITPLIANLRIDITLVCLEMRGPRNFSR